MNDYFFERRVVLVFAKKFFRAVIVKKERKRLNFSETDLIFPIAHCVS